MNEVWVTLIGVVGALTGGLLGSWITAKVSKEAQASSHQHERERERREAFCAALNALLIYRSLEIRRAAEARDLLVPVDDVPSANAARAARATCRYHLVVLQVLIPEGNTAPRYGELLKLVHEVSRRASMELAAHVKADIELFARDFGQSLR